MKSSLLPLFCLLALAGWAVAEKNPKLAVAGVQASAELTKQYQDAAGKAHADAAKDAGLEGTWQGVFAPRARNHNQAVVTIKRSAEGTLQGHWRSLTTGVQKDSAWAEFRDNVLTLRFAPKQPGPSSLEGVVDLEAGTWAATLNGNGHAVLKRLAGGESPESAAKAAEPPVNQLQQVLHSFDVQLANRFEKMGLFDVVDQGSLKSFAPVRGGDSAGGYSLAQPEVAQQFRVAGIDYLLQATLQDFQDQAIDLSREVTARQNSSYTNSSSVRHTGPTSPRPGPRSGVDRSASGSSQSQQSVGAAQVNRSQIVRVTVQFELFDTAKAMRLGSVLQTFRATRPYTALARGSNTLAQTDLFEAAARDVADRAAILVSENVFPILVLDRGEKEVTINRGGQAGLKIGQVYRVFTPGKELKDPVTGRVLGNDENEVGRVAISDIRTEFSKASVLEDKGIKNGARLRWLQAK